VKGFILFVTSAVLLLMTGCASLIDGKQQTVSFASNPDNATVWLNGVQIGKTPVSIPLARKGGSQPLKFTKEGYKDVEIPMTSTMNPWLLGNLLSGGLLGSTTDGLSGAAYKYSPGNYMVTLQPADAPATPGGTTLTDKQKVVNFIVEGYSHINAELTSTAGPYVASMMQLASVPEAARADMEKKVKALSEVYTTIPEFADKTADLLLKK
jgi:hypothetical protein